METIESSVIRLSVHDGTEMQAYTTRPKGLTPSRGLLVFQEAFGVNAHIRDLCERFAHEGFFTIAPELFHRTAEGFEGDYTNFAQSRPHMEALTPEGLEVDIRAAYNWLQQEGHLDLHPIHAVGYCLGGRTAFFANTFLPLTSAVSFYGGGTTTLLDHIEHLHGPMLFCWGGKDTHIPAEQRNTITDALDRSGKNYTSIIFGAADHGFFCDARQSYHAKSATLAWPLTVGFLKQE